MPGSCGPCSSGGGPCGPRACRPGGPERASGPPGDISQAQLDNAISGMLLLRDRPGIAAADPRAHGSAFDRVTAFKDGFDNGPKACAGYTDRSIGARLVALPFLDAGTAQRRQLRPSRKCRLCSSDGSVDVSGVGQMHLASDGAGGRIGHHRFRRADPGAVNETGFAQQ